MKKINFSYNFLVFLYAFLRQIDLSLDRSRWFTIYELKKHYEDSDVNPNKVLKYLMKENNINFKDFNIKYEIEKPSLFSRCRNSMYKVLNLNSFLTRNELYFCCQNLYNLNQFLNNCDGVEKVDIEKLRIELSKFTYENLEDKLFSKDYIKAMSIEHFAQNENIKTVNIEYFINGFNL